MGLIDCKMPPPATQMLASCLSLQRSVLGKAAERGSMKKKWAGVRLFMLSVDV